jgi:hypothetical protein
MRWIILLPLAATACVNVAPHRALATPNPIFSAEHFFDGSTEGIATLKIMMQKPQPVHVHGHGHIDPDGTLVLEQKIEQGAKPVTTRVWHIRAVAPGRYTGTLSGAAGLVTGDVRGNRLRLRFKGKDGLHYRQWLYLSADGQVAQNRMLVRKWGMPVAALNETIRRVDSPQH